MIPLVMNWIAIIGAAVLLSLSFGWKIGLGVTLLVWFLKAPE